jgi:hypothetical protein
VVACNSTYLKLVTIGFAMLSGDEVAMLDVFAADLTVSCNALAEEIGEQRFFDLVVRCETVGVADELGDAAL